jgi:hypothetical protein
MADSNKCHVYVNLVPGHIITTYTNTAMDFTRGDFYIGNRGDAPGFFAWSGHLGDIYYYPGTYLDLSLEANRRLFVTVGGKPTNPSIPVASLGSPIIGIWSEWNDWPTNNGTGGGFTNTGVDSQVRITGL